MYKGVINVAADGKIGESHIVEKDVAHGIGLIANLVVGGMREGVDAGNIGLIEGQDGDLFGTGYGKGPKDKTIHYTEKSRVHSHAQGEGQHGNGSKAEILPEHANGISQVLPDG